jgi:hypothetical protein
LPQHRLQRRAGRRLDQQLRAFPTRQAGQRHRHRFGDQSLNSSRMLSMPAWMASNDSLRARSLQA